MDVGLTSASKRKPTTLNIVSIIEVKERMLGACFDGLIVNQYGLMMFLAMDTNISTMIWLMFLGI